MSVPCGLCGHRSTVAFETRRDGIPYHRCFSCGYVQKDASRIPTNDEERRRYLLHENDAGDPGYVRWLESFLEFSLIPELPVGAGVLDFGSGPEPVLAGMLRGRGYEVSLEDPYFAPGIPPGPFHLITALEVFEHLSRPRDVLNSLTSRLLPRGRLCISTEFLPQKPEDFENWHYRSDPTHIGFFTKRGLLEAAESAGLEGRECDGRRYIAFAKPPC